MALTRLLPRPHARARTTRGPAVARVIAFANQKGGVAKTTTTLNLGVALAEKGLRVLAVDLDPQGNLTMSQGWNPDEIDRSMFDVLVHKLPVTEIVRQNEIDVAVFSFDDASRLRLANRAAERLLGRTREQILGWSASDLALSECLEGESPRIVSKTFPEKAGRWEIRRGVFRQDGLPHRLLVISDISRALRDEERQTWRRLIRVMGHELNNSLAPLKSVAESLRDILGRRQLPDDWREDMTSGLALIASRTEALSRFVDGYARLAKLPSPRPAPLDVGAWIHRVAGLEQRLAIRVLDGPALAIQADAGQLEQLLINLIRNAVDASLETGGGVQVGWQKNGESLEVLVRDEGPGLSNPGNVFIPFFTTKPGGSGIGLVLSREIAEAHGGTLDAASVEHGEFQLVLPCVQNA